MNCNITESDLEIPQHSRRLINHETRKQFGRDLFQNKRINKGLAFTSVERQLLGLTGLLPKVSHTLEDQVEHYYMLLDRLASNLDKYIFLRQLEQRNELLFYNMITSDPFNIISFIYTPTITEVCLNFSLIYPIAEQATCLFISYEDKGNIFQILGNWPIQDIRAICVTDGERTLGLGDMGIHAAPVCISNLILYTGIAGIKPHQLLPVILDVGTNRKSLIEDPLYMGLCRERVTRQEHDAFLFEFVVAVVHKYGYNCLIHFEDFERHNAFNLLKKYQHRFCTFNNDIQGCATLIMAGILTALKLTNAKLIDLRVLCYGGGEVGFGCAQIIKTALKQEGLTETEAKEKIWIVDSKGLIVKNRQCLSSIKSEWAQSKEPLTDLLDIIELARPNVLMGASSQGGAFTSAVLEAMAKINERPIIFPFSNSNLKVECTAEKAYLETQGKCLFMSGTIFPPFEYENKFLYPSQALNLNVFPGLVLGVISCGMRTIPDELYTHIARKLSTLVTDEQLEKEQLFPSSTNLRMTAFQVAVAVMEFAYETRLADLRPEPRDKIAFLRLQLYDLEYPDVIPSIFQQSITINEEALQLKIKRKAAKTKNLCCKKIVLKKKKN